MKRAAQVLLLLLSPAAGYLLACVVIGLFVLPFHGSMFAVRVLTTFGIAGLGYAYDLATTVGWVETCGFLSGNCSRHDFRLTLQVVWFICTLVLAAGVLYFMRRPGAKK